MRFHVFVLLAASLACLAQVPGAATAPASGGMPAGPKAPPEVDQALRARVNAFLDYESKGNNRKAYDLVAEDSKDYYFEAKKEKSTSFTIDEIQYGAGLSTATVRSTMKRQVMLAGHPVDLPQALISRWKIEKGEWVWYHDPSQDVTNTILGPLPVAAADAPGDSPLPKDLSHQAAVATAGKMPIPMPAIDKKAVTFTLGKDGSEQVMYHNNTNGQVRVLADVRGVADTITVEPNDLMVNPGADVPFKIVYKAHPDSSMRGGVLFTVEPFGSVVGLPVRFARERQVPASPAPGSPAPAAAPPTPTPTVP